LSPRRRAGRSPSGSRRAREDERAGIAGGGARGERGSLRSWLNTIAANACREAPGFTGAEVAEALETTPDAVYSALQRAHKTVDERLPERTQQATLRSLEDEELRGTPRDTSTHGSTPTSTRSPSALPRTPP
jgi:hypothetical protein